MKLRITALIGFFFLVLALPIYINIVAFNTPNPSIVHDLICKPQNLLRLTFILPVLQPDYVHKCHLDFAFKFSNPSFCKYTKSYTKRNNCYSSLALLKKDPTYCENILFSPTEYNSCIEELIIYSKNLEYCYLFRDDPTSKFFSNSEEGMERCLNRFNLEQQ